MGELVDIGDTSLAVRRSGRGPAVLLIHGTAPATLGRPPATARRDARRHRLRPARLRRLPGTAARTLSDHADDAAGRSSNRRRAGMVVGWSVGGVIALELACRRPRPRRRPGPARAAVSRQAPPRPGDGPRHRGRHGARQARPPRSRRRALPALGARAPRRNERSRPPRPRGAPTRRPGDRRRARLRHRRAPRPRRDRGAHHPRQRSSPAPRATQRSPRPPDVSAALIPAAASSPRRQRSRRALDAPNSWPRRFAGSLRPSPRIRPATPPDPAPSAQGRRRRNTSSPGR